jgi:ribonuclease inhibitor
MELRLDSRLLDEKEALHKEITRQLQLPLYYGENLDALWDILTAWGNPLTIVIENCGESLAQLGSHGETVMQLFQEAEEENNNLSVDFRM